MKDIGPELLEILQKEFSDNVEKNSEITRLMKLIKDGTADYKTVEDFAYCIGEALAKAFGDKLSSDILPDGRLYYNIAERVVRPLLEDDYKLISSAAADVQASLNAAAGIGIKAQKAELNHNRINGIIDKVSNAEHFDDVSWVLDEPVKNFSLSVVDETIRKNVEFHGKVGLTPKVIRKAEHKCCKWCSLLAGEYTYPDVPDDVYRRHENCRCTVEYNPGDGKRQNVWTKQWQESEKYDKINKRKDFADLSEVHEKLFPTNPKTGEPYIKHKLHFSEKQFGKKVGKHAQDYGLNPQSYDDREKILKIINDIAENADERFYGEWRGQEYPVLYHLKENDVVLESKNGEFITLLKGGITNERVKNQRRKKV